VRWYIHASKRSRRPNLCQVHNRPLFWAAILFMSVRLAWRHFHHSHASNPFVPVIMRLLECLTPSGATQFASFHPQINR
jgi:hypothetical protein